MAPHKGKLYSVFLDKLSNLTIVGFHIGPIFFRIDGPRFNLLRKLFKIFLCLIHTCSFCRLGDKGGVWQVINRIRLLIPQGYVS